jgi:hypothetical protein
LVLDAAVFDERDVLPELAALTLRGEKGAWKRLAAAAACPRFQRIIEPDPSRRVMWELYLPELSSLRQLARARVASMRLALRRGDTDEFLRGADESMAIVRACASQFTLIDRLVGHAVASMVLPEIRRSVQETAMKPETLEEISTAMERQLRLPPIELSMRGEEQSLLDLLQYCFTDDGHGDGVLDANRFESLVEYAVTSPGQGVPMATFAGGLLERRAETE